MTGRSDGKLVVTTSGIERRESASVSETMVMDGVWMPAARPDSRADAIWGGV